MKIVITSDQRLLIRARHFINTLRSRGHVVEVQEYGHGIPDADMWIFDYLYGTSNYFTYNKENIASYESQFFEFKGKLALMCIGDGCNLHPSAIISDKLQKRIDCIISFLRYPENHIHSRGVYSKIVLIPRYTVNYERRAPQPKENKIFFVGRLTGGVMFGGANWRVEAFKKIYANEFLRSNFTGWLQSINSRILVDANKCNDEYNRTIIGTSPTVLSHEEYNQRLDKTLISLCLPGNTNLGYRHFQSIICKSTVISFQMENDPGEWLYQTAFNDSFYFVNDDLSNLEMVMEYSLLNTQETILRQQIGWDRYLQYYELLPTNIYQKHICNALMEKFNEVGIML